MTIDFFYLATEDQLSEAVGTRLLRDLLRVQEIQPIRRGDFGYLKTKVLELNRTAVAIPVLLLTDLDTEHCPTALISKWLGNTTRNANFLFRIAVRETESWLLADSSGIAQALDVPVERVPESPDNLRDPKQTVIRLAQRSRNAAIRRGFTPPANSTTPYGPDYFQIMLDYVQNRWDINTASQRSASLSRAINAIQEF